MTEPNLNQPREIDAVASGPRGQETFASLGTRALQFTNYYCQIAADIHAPARSPWRVQTHTLCKHRRSKLHTGYPSECFGGVIECVTDGRDFL